MSNNLVENNVAKEQSPLLYSILNTGSDIVIKQELQETEINKEEVSKETVKNDLKKISVENSTNNIGGGDFCEQVTVVDNYSDVTNIKYELDIKDEIVDDDYEDEIQINKEIHNQDTTVDDEASKFLEVTYEDKFGVDLLESIKRENIEHVNNPSIKVVHGNEKTQQATVILNESHSNLIKVKYKVNPVTESIDINHSSQKSVENVDDKGTKWQQCHFCEYKTKSRYNLRRHIEARHSEIKVVHGSEKTQQATVILNKSHSNLIQMKYEDNLDIEAITINHFSQKSVVNVDDEGTKWQQCLFCEHKTKTRYNLRRHIEAKHSEIVEWHQCQFCELKVKCKESLRRHIKFAHDDNTEWLPCMFCDFRTKRRFHLNKHIKTKHSENSVEWYDCNFCDLRTRNKGNLRQHLKFKHRIIDLV